MKIIFNLNNSHNNKLKKLIDKKFSKRKKIIAKKLKIHILHNKSIKLYKNIKIKSI